MASLTGFDTGCGIFSTDILSPNGTYNPAITKFRHWYRFRRFGADGINFTVFTRNIALTLEYP
jgi:hypothetical protein